ncbi:hypothetical protein [Haladaptatus cibarius]|uniref:hypothetical protein n=1 Tax=Haladaptatus cibarius TaxID=453847 RepID=UPI000679C953|nr:hypothetical protein [Haladaptatus cibarius]
MKKALRITIALAVVASLFAVGFTGMAAADDEQKQSSWQYADSDVDQKQYVNQQNFNKQDDNYAIAVKGNAEATQANKQANINVQYADSEAENENKQFQWWD